MATKRRKKAKGPKKPEGVVAPVAGASELQAILEAGTLDIDKKKLAGFIKKLEKIKYPKVQFVARNAPFMRRLPIAPV